MPNFITVNDSVNYLQCSADQMMQQLLTNPDTGVFNHFMNIGAKLDKLADFAKDKASVLQDIVKSTFKESTKELTRLFINIQIEDNTPKIQTLIMGETCKISDFKQVTNSTDLVNIVADNLKEIETPYIEIYVSDTSKISQMVLSIFVQLGKTVNATLAVFMIPKQPVTVPLAILNHIPAFTEPCQYIVPTTINIKKASYCNNQANYEKYISGLKKHMNTELSTHYIAYYNGEDIETTEKEQVVQETEDIEVTEEVTGEVQVTEEVTEEIQETTEDTTNEEPLVQETKGAFEEFETDEFTLEVTETTEEVAEETHTEDFVEETQEEVTEEVATYLAEEEVTEPADTQVIQELEGRIEELVAELKGTEGTIDELEIKNGQLETIIERLKKELDEEKSKQLDEEASSKQIDKLMNEIVELRQYRSKYEHIQAESKAKQEEYDKVEELIVKLKSDLQASQDNISTLLEENTTLRNKVTELEYKVKYESAYSDLFNAVTTVEAIANRNNDMLSIIKEIVLTSLTEVKLDKEVVDHTYSEVNITQPVVEAYEYDMEAKSDTSTSIDINTVPSSEEIEKELEENLDEIGIKHDAPDISHVLNDVKDEIKAVVTEDTEDENNLVVQPINFDEEEVQEAEELLEETVEETVEEETVEGITEEEEEDEEEDLVIKPLTELDDMSNYDIDIPPMEEIQEEQLEELVSIDLEEEEDDTEIIIPSFDDVEDIDFFSENVNVKDLVSRVSSSLDI